MTNYSSDYIETKQIESDEAPPIIKVAFLDVGQGDTIVVSCPTTREAIVVDCTDANSVLDYLEQEQVAYLRGVIITHLHEDHYREVAILLKNCSLAVGIRTCEVLAFNEVVDRKNRQVLIQDADEHSSHYGNLLGRRPTLTSYSSLLRWRDQEENKSKYALIRVQRGTFPPKNTLANILDLDGTLARNMYLVHPYAGDFIGLESKGLNNTSVALYVKGPGSSALLTGDLEPAGWQGLLKNHPVLHSDVLKFPHHGGTWQAIDADNLLKTVQPSAVVISVGTEGEKYRHPHKDVFAALAKYPNIRVLCTQATNQCQSSVLDKRVPVIKQLDLQASSNSQQRIGSKSKQGCPCAGTVIVELGDEMRVLQPSLNVHYELIIGPHFKTHQCIIKGARQRALVVKEAYMHYDAELD